MNKRYTSILSLGALAGCRSAQPKDATNNTASNPASQSIDGVVNEAPVPELVSGKETVPVNEVPILLAPTSNPTETTAMVAQPSSNGFYQCIKDHPYAISALGVGVVLALGTAYVLGNLYNPKKSKK